MPPPNDERDVDSEAISLQKVIDDLQVNKPRFSLFIVDACRDNPLPKTRGRSIGANRGLAATHPADGQMIIFSAGTGQQALDRLSDTDRNPNSVFTRELLKEMRTPNVAVDQVLRNVRSRVRQAAQTVNHDQFPALYDQSDGQFFFKIGTPIATLTVPQIANAQAPISRHN